MLDDLINFFVLLFVVIDPVGLAPMYAGLSRHHTDEERRRMANQATMLAAGILLLFAMAGPGLLRILGIGVPAFRMAGGLLLLLLAVDMVFARQSGLRSTTLAEQDEARTRQDVSVFPLAFPLIAGPGALTIVLLTFGTGSGHPWWFTGGLYLVILAVLALTALALHLATPMVRLLGRTGTNVIDRLFGVLLAALAVQFMVDGWQALQAPSGVSASQVHHTASMIGHDRSIWAKLRGARTL